MHTTGSRPKLVVSSDGRGVVSHAGARLLADLAEVTGLTRAFSDALCGLRPRGTGHDPGRIATDLAVMLADGGQAIADLSLLRHQAEVFGPVASTPTAWRLLAGIDSHALARLRTARAAAREAAWLQAAETRNGIPAARAGGRDLPGLLLDIDATLVTCHSDKEQAAPTYKRGFGYHPLLCFLDNTGEALAGLLRAGNAGANAAADHITVLDAALAQIPDAHRHGTDVLIRADSAGGAKAFLAHIRSLRAAHIRSLRAAHIRSLRARGTRTFFSVGHSVTEPVRRAIRALPDQVWHPAVEQDGSLREGAQVAELTGMVDLAGYPDGTRIVVRRERPHPGAQLSLFDLDEGMRHQVFLTDTPYGAGSLQQPEARHRTHASKTASGAARPPDSAASPPATSPSTPPGWSCPSPLPTCSPGRAPCCWKESWPPPNRRSSATDCCTQPPDSPAAAAASTCGSPPPGHGGTNWQTRSHASPPCPGQPPDQRFCP